MGDQLKFLEIIQKGYSFKGSAVKIGRAMLDGQVVPGADIMLPLKTMNRHGLVAGATGTGKTKTLQVLAEALSNAGVPVMLMDIKGDLSGIAAPAQTNEKINERCAKLEINFEPAAFPVELMVMGKEKGIPLRATVTEFGPVLLSRILGLNDTQGGLVAMIFKYCDDHKLPLVDLKDFTRVLQYFSDEGRQEIEKEYGRISTASMGTILRKVIELQQQGADDFFGEKSFDVADLMRQHTDGRGMISIIRLINMQDRPKMFSTFMLQLLAELYAACPEEGDLEKPKLVLFIDEAHLVFDDATEALLQQIETVIKLIRSKGIGIFFCTQNPKDIPADVLSQLGLKIQHALRAFTAADRKAIKKASENYPETEFYETENIITQLGIGEALVSFLNEKGIPTPLAHTMMVPPRSRMDILTDDELNSLINASVLKGKYAEPVDPVSAYDILKEKMERAAEHEDEEEETAAKGRKKKEESIFDSPTMRQVGRTAASVLTRTLLGALGLNTTRRRRIW